MLRDSLRPASRGANRPRWRDPRVIGKEEVNTPAGSFQAFKIEKEERWALRTGGSGRTMSVYFYSPATKSVVKSYFEQRGPGSGKREIELIKFGSAP